MPAKAAPAPGGRLSPQNARPRRNRSALSSFQLCWSGPPAGSLPAPARCCVAHAAGCIEVAEKACTTEDRREFLSFADAWEKLATEIEQSERLVAFIDELTTNTDEDAVREGSELPQRSYTKPLRQLAAAIVAISDHVASDATAHHLALLLKRQPGQA